ncbi:hypothetical protein FDP41_004481 [Naegleria fowleri]|uniref:Uncharacterized protein n=1 Tax=Naegleria fowleri TaxID=5763 RepID=A0A6A5BP60_NAEFO|nr:uncharacterized protein FDP41_004481 [Naegleria fowleri]KAF0976582.1 hypothetical protein FDP41_004481 [Naegleria fowleri]
MFRQFSLRPIGMMLAHQQQAHKAIHSRSLVVLSFSSNQTHQQERKFSSIYSLNLAGHNKWSKIKHQKAITDVQKMKIYTKLSREIKTCVQLGGAGADNLRLRLCLEKARKNNVPKHIVDGAIKSGLNEKDAHMEYNSYEGYGAGGVAFLVEALTENKNRTAQQVRTLFSHHKGQLGTSVQWCFEKKGVVNFTIPIAHSKMDSLYDSLFEKVSDIEGVEDLKLEPTENEMEKQFIEVSLFCPHEQVHNVKASLESAKTTIEKALNITITNITCEIGQVPTTFIEVTDAEVAENLQQLIDQLDDHDDVQNVYHNAKFALPDEE